MERFLPERGLLRQVTVLRSAQLHLQTDAAAERKWLQSLNLPASGLPSVAGWCGKGTQAKRRQQKERDDVWGSSRGGENPIAPPILGTGISP